jgi:hypothetical protein
MLLPIFGSINNNKSFNQTNDTFSQSVFHKIRYLTKIPDNVILPSDLSSLHKILYHLLFNTR